MTRKTFWDVYRPGCCEHLLIHKLRKVPAFVKELSYVAVEPGTILCYEVYGKSIT